MSSSQAAVEFRFMLRDKADSLAPGDPEDLQNIDTGNLPNGSHCYVTSRKSLYVFNKFSTLTANGVDVFAPNCNVGRWYLMTSSVTGCPPVELYSSNPNDFAADAAMHQPSTALFAYQETGNLGVWNLTASGGVLTYLGPDCPAIATLTASVSVDDAAALRSILGFISHNDDDPGFVVGTTVAGVVQVVQTVADQVQMLVAQRFIPALQSGNTIRSKFGTSAAATGGNILSLQLIVRPL